MGNKFAHAYWFKLNVNGKLNDAKKSINSPQNANYNILTEAFSAGYRNLFTTLAINKVINNKEQKILNFLNNIQTKERVKYFVLVMQASLIYMGT